MLRANEGPLAILLREDRLGRENAVSPIECDVETTLRMGRLFHPHPARRLSTHLEVLAAGIGVRPHSLQGVVDDALHRPVDQPLVPGASCAR
jgi:hypothetical protein